MAVKYLYRSQLSTSFEDITKLVDVHASGSETLNELPGGFKFKINPYKKINGVTSIYPIDINIGDEILLLDDDNFLAYGSVFDPGRELIYWDHKNDKAICSFNLNCLQDDFSSSLISKQEFTQTTAYEVLNFISEYTDNSLNEPAGKIVFSFPDFPIDNYTIEKKTAREALAEFCQNYDLIWFIKHAIITDPTELYKVFRFIDINPSSGVVPPPDSTWYSGIINDHVSKGKIPNPITTNLSRARFVPGEKDFSIQTDPSVILNHIELNGKVFTSITPSGELEVYYKSAEPDKMEYELNGYASDVTYVGIWTKDTVKVLTGSTSTLIKLESRYCTGLEVGNIAYFPSHPTDFFPITAINKIDDFITEISLNLSFTPTIGEEFQIAGNTPVYKKESDINYASKGCIFDTNKSSYTKIKFLDLSEPNASQRIIFCYRRVKDLPLVIKNDESIAKYGLKYKEIKLDDDISYSEEELQNLASKLLTLKPAYGFSFFTDRYGLAPVGMSLPVKIDNFITENFILNSIEWEHIHNYDINRKSLIRQRLDFNTNVNNSEKIIERFNRQKKNTSSSVNDKEKNIQIEKISALENISFTILDQGTEITSLSFKNDGTTLRIEFTAISGTYDIRVYSDSNLTNQICSASGFGANITWEEISHSSIASNNTFYVRMRVQINSIWSDWSNILDIEKYTYAEKIIYSSNKSGQWQIWQMDTDGTNHVNITNDSSKEDHYATYSLALDSYIFSRKISGRLEVHKKDRKTGTVTQLTSGSSYDCKWANFSPDGSKIAFSRNGQIIIISNTGTLLYTLTKSTHPISAPRFLDNTHLIYSYASPPPYEIRKCNLDGSGEITLKSDYGIFFPAVSPDGTKIILRDPISSSPPNDKDQVSIMNSDGSGLTMITSTSIDHEYPCYSPDMTKFAFISPAYSGNIYTASISSPNSHTNRTNTGDSYELNDGWKIMRTD